MEKRTVLHISGDFPDRIRESTKTRAIFNLIQASTGLHHLVFSLNRSGTPGANRITRRGNLFEVSYFGLPYGLFMMQSLARVARDIARTVEQEGIHFDLIHAHKLTIEGVVAELLSQRLQRPFVTTVRGMTDFHIIRYRPQSRSRYRTVVEKSTLLFFLAPWSRRVLQEIFPGQELAGKSSLLPNIVRQPDPALRPQPTMSKRFITSVRLDAHNYRNKNLDQTLKAFARASREMEGVTLEIFALGQGRRREALQEMIASLPCRERVLLRSPLANDAFVRALPQYIAFVLPSFPETFGMVYLEALFMGLPVLHSKDTAIDGYFDHMDISCRVDHQSVAEIAGGLKELYQNQKQYKENLAQLLKDHALDRFSPGAITAAYEQCLLPLTE